MGDHSLVLLTDYEYIIQTCFFLRTEYIFISKLDLKEYLKACGQKFAINFDCKQNVYLYNQNHAEIPANRFEQIVNMYWRDAAFCINIVVESIKSNTLDITPKDLQNFLAQRNRGEILDKGRERSAQISESERKDLIKHAHAYISTKLEKVEEFHIVLLAKTLVALVPCLVDSTEGEHSGYGITLGFLLKKFNNHKYNQKAAAKRKRSSKRTSKNATTTTNKRASSSSKRNSTQIEARKSIGKKDITENGLTENDLTFFKSFVANETNVKQIEAKLQSTAAQRMKFLRNKKMDFLEKFPFLFTHPSLALYDFKVHFPEVDSNALIAKWPNFGSNVKEILKEHYSTTVNTGWSENIEQMLALLKILPAKAGRNAGPVVPFVQAIDKLIVHSEIAKPLQKDLDKNVHPFIIACGPTKENITHFYVVIENHLMNVPVDWNFVQVLDLLFKVHMIFNIRFEYNIAPAMKFIGYFLFEIKTKEFEPALRARNLHAKFE